MRSAVVVKIHAGLGNQMFQYAAGRALAARSGSRLVLDNRYFRYARLHAYGLHHFNIRHDEDPRALPPLLKGLGVRHFLWKRLKLKPRLVAEASLAFDEQMLLPRANVYLDGFWQSERYFRDALETIREDFRIVTPPDRENARLAEEIEGCQAVALHVRRGDYLLPANQAIQGSCSLEYYARALEFVASRLREEPVVYVFSDDPGWARDNIKPSFATRVMDHNGPDRNYEDIRLMSACRHHIIANSTFSWWGAWLSRSPGKIVTAPKRWFANPRFHNPDITPESWHRIDG